MKLAIVFVLGSFQFGGPQEHTRAGDRWFARDKALHFAATAAIQSVGHTALRAAGADYRDASIAAGAISLSVGVGKEIWDRSQGRYFSWKDLTADGFGGASAAVLVRQIDR